MVLDCPAFGTLAPIDGFFGSRCSAPRPTGHLRRGVCMAGCIRGKAASPKRDVRGRKEAHQVQPESVIVATFSGIMSACFLACTRETDKKLAPTGTTRLWTGLPVLVPVLLGGFTTNFVWCLILNIRNKSGHEYLDGGSKDLRVPIGMNYFFSALAGVTWYFQFFFYTMGETQMGAYKFSSWTLHMASIIIFSSLWGIALHEWRGAGARTKGWLAVSLAVLVLSTMVVGYGNYLGTLPH